MEKFIVNWMDHILGEGWKITTAGGATGEAYIAQNHTQRLFLKRNSSPFIAVLSAEGIVPKLLWTKRLENGDVITAQKWLEGRELKSLDMINQQVSFLMSKIHHSSELLDMLKRIGKETLTTAGILEDIHQKKNVSYPIIDKAIAVLSQQSDRIEKNNKVVCHCDVNHNNWLLSHTGDLYLIDWDGAMIADPAIDLGLLLYSYIPEEKWSYWLSNYGVSLTEDLKERMDWYMTAHSILSIYWHEERNEWKEKGQWLEALKKIIN